MTRRGNLRSMLGLLILTVSIFTLVWGYMPAQRELRLRPLSISTQPALPEKRHLSLLYPPKIRAGDVGVVRLTLEVAAAQNGTPAAENGNENESSEFYNTHHVIIETRFDLPGIDIRPSDTISAPIEKGQTPVFYWTLRPRLAGSFEGTIWLYLRMVDKTTGQEHRETVSSQRVEIEAVSLLGLSANRARLLGLAGAAIGLALSLPFFRAQITILLKNRQNP